MPTPEAKCIVEMDPMGTDRVVAIVKSQLQEMNREDMLEELTRVPVTVLRFENVPTVSSVALIGYKPGEVTDIEPDYSNFHSGKIAITFRTPEEEAHDTYQRITIRTIPIRNSFSSLGSGDIDVTFERIGTDGGSDGNSLMQGQLTPSVIAQVSLPGAYYAENCIVTTFSRAVNDRLIAGGIQVQPPFAIVQNVRA